MRLAEIFVGVRPDGRDLPKDLKKSLAGANSDKLGQDEGHKFSKGFGSGLGKLGAAAGAALAGLALGGKLKESVSAASDLNETVSKTQQIFGKSADAIVAFGKKAPTALGQSQQAALDANSTFGLFGKTAGLSGKGLVGFTTQLTTLSGDLASFNNTSPEQAIEAVGAALRGESEPIRAYGVLLDDATLKAEGMRLGLVKASKDTGKIEAAQLRAELAQRKYNEAVKAHGKGSTEAKTAEAGLLGATNALKTATTGTIAPLTQSQRVLAARSVIMRQTTAAQGDFARTSQGLANQERIAAAQVNTLKVAIGTALLPVVLQGAHALNTELLPPLIDLAQKHGPALAAALTKITTGAGPAITQFFRDAGPTVKSFADGTNSASPALSSLADSGQKLAPVLKQLHDQMPSLTDALNVGAAAVGFFADHTDTLIKLMPLIVAAFVAYKVAQALANVAELAALPIKISTIIANKQLAASNRELIAARVQDTVATEAGIVAQFEETSAKNVGLLTSIRMRAAIIAQAIAQKAATVATKVWAAGQWLLNAALTANPIGLVIVAIGLLVAAFILAWKHSETFRKIATAAFNGLKSIAISVIQAVWGTISGFFQNLLDGAAKAFGWVPGIGPKLKTAATEFGKFRDSVNTKLAGLKDQSIDVTANLKSWGTPELLAAAHGRATGGKGGPYDGFKVRGPGGPTDDKAGLYALSNTEWVIKGKSSAKYGDYAMRSVNDGTATIIPGMATGGKAGVVVRDQLPSAGDQGVAAGNVNTAVRYIGLTMAKQLSKNLAKSLFAPGLVGTLQWLKTQVGKPYQWGAVGPNAYDCSGLVSAAINRAYGKNPYSRLGATGSMPWASMAAGTGPFQVGWFKGNPGHTAMTINGINVESAGGVGVRMGPGARGAKDRLFNQRRKVKGFAGGGPVAEGNNRGDLPFDVFDPRGHAFMGQKMADFLDTAPKLKKAPPAWNTRIRAMLHQLHLAHLAHQAHITHRAHLLHESQEGGLRTRGPGSRPPSTGKAPSKQLLQQLGIPIFDQGGVMAPHSLGANLSNHNETVVAGGNSDGSVRLDTHTIRALGQAFAAAVAEQPVVLDGTRLDSAVSGLALKKTGYR